MPSPHLRFPNFHGQQDNSTGHNLLKLLYNQNSSCFSLGLAILGRGGDCKEGDNDNQRTKVCQTLCARAGSNLHVALDPTRYAALRG